MFGKCAYLPNRVRPSSSQSNWSKSPVSNHEAQKRRNTVSFAAGFGGGLPLELEFVLFLVVGVGGDDEGGDGGVEGGDGVGLPVVLQQAPLAHPVHQLPQHVLPALPQQVALVQLIKHPNGHFLGTDLHITSSHIKRNTCAVTYDAICLRGLYGVHLHLGVLLADAVLELGPNELYQAIRIFLSNSGTKMHVFVPVLSDNIGMVPMGLNWQW